MNITIAGYGFVGQAHKALFSKSHTINIYDPAKELLEFGNPDAVIVCVSTPQSEDGSCYMEYVFDVIDLINPSIPVLIKSTISLEGWKELKERFPSHKISFSPEFLRQASAIDDVLSATEVLIGNDYDDFWTDVFMDNDHKLTVRQYAAAEELILAKYLRNSFLALKVSFFNQAYDFCNALGIDFNEVREATTLDSRIGDSHSYVPGPSGERGFGGHCFPKDTSAIVETAKKFGVDLSLIKKAREYNENFNNRS
jgi:UDPglucose 6-dehydrogenase